MENLCKVRPILKSLDMFRVCLGILIFSALATLLNVEIQVRPDDIMLMSSGCLRLRLNFWLPMFFL